MTTVVAYPLDEASSGTGVSTVLDHGPSGYDLTMVYVGGEPVWEEVAQGRGFSWDGYSYSDPPGACAKRLIVADDAIESAINGAQRCTLEAVGEIILNQWNSGATNLFGIFQHDGEYDALGLWWWGGDLIVDVTGQGGYPSAYTANQYSYGVGGRTPGVHVFHVVWDSTLPNEDDRLRLYIDGELQTFTGHTGEHHAMPVLNDSIRIPSSPDQYLSIGGFNNYSYGPSTWPGAVYYARLDDTALSASQVAARAAALATNYDLPEGGTPTMSKSNSFENSILALLFNATAIADVAENDSSGPLTSLYVSLHTSDPGEAGNQSSNETAYPSYARVAVARSGSGWTVTGNSVSPAATITFPQSTSGTQGGPITHFGIGSAASGAGVLYYSGTVTPNITMAEGVRPELTTATAITED